MTERMPAKNGYLYKTLVSALYQQVKDFYQELKVKEPCALNLKKFKVDTLKLKDAVSKISFRVRREDL